MSDINDSNSSFSIASYQDLFKRNEPESKNRAWSPLQKAVACADIAGGIEGGLEGGTFGPWGALAGGFVGAALSSGIVLWSSSIVTNGTGSFTNPSLIGSRFNSNHIIGVLHNNILLEIGNDSINKFSTINHFNIDTLTEELNYICSSTFGVNLTLDKFKALSRNIADYAINSGWSYTDIINRSISNSKNRGYLTANDSVIIYNFTRVLVEQNSISEIEQFTDEFEQMVINDNALTEHSKRIYLIVAAIGRCLTAFHFHNINRNF